MPDKKISELVNLTSLAADDEFVVVDADANATKRTTYDTLATEIRTEAEALTGTTGTFSGDITSNGETVYHRGNILGTVTQSGGTPTGAVIERDSNANGEYVKYADGTMLCFMSGQQIGTAGGTATITVQYPASFTISSNNRRVATREIKTLVDFGTQAYDGTGDGASAVGSSIPKVATRNTSSPFEDQVVVAIEGLQTNTSRYQDYAILAVGRWF